MESQHLSHIHLFPFLKNVCVFTGWMTGTNSSRGQEGLRVSLRAAVRGGGHENACGEEAMEGWTDG